MTPSPLLADINNSLLLCIDIQERLTGAMPEDSLSSVLQSTEVLLRAATALELPLLVTEQYPKGLGPTHSSISQHLPENLSPIEKTCFACNDADDFMQALKNAGRKQVIITGMES